VVLDWRVYEEVRLRLGSKSTLSSSRAQKLLGQIKLACFFRDGSSGQPQTP
jgi:hypothetical protein